jgi:hypothetical protein
MEQLIFAEIDINEPNGVKEFSAVMSDIASTFFSKDPRAEILYANIEGDPSRQMLALFCDGLMLNVGLESIAEELNISVLALHGEEATITGTHYGELIADTGPHTSSPGTLLTLAYDVAEEALGDFDAWYNEEHVPDIMHTDGWLRVRRFRIQPEGIGPRWNRIAIHEILGPTFFDAPRRPAPRDLAWRQRLGTTEWWKTRSRGLYRVDNRWKSAVSWNP